MPGRLTNRKLGLDGDLGDVFATPFDKVDNGLRRDLAHLDQWLPYRRESGIGVRRAGDVVEADDGNIFRHTQTRFVDGPDRADCRNVVVSEKRREGMLPCEELLGEGIANAGGRIDAFELDSQLGANANFELLCYFADSAPTHSGIRADGLTLDEGDFFVTEIAKMFQGQPCGALVIEDDVGHVFDAFMPRHP